MANFIDIANTYPPEWGFPSPGSVEDKIRQMVAQPPSVPGSTPVPFAPGSFQEMAAQTGGEYVPEGARPTTLGPTVPATGYTNPRDPYGVAGVGPAGGRSASAITNAPTDITSNVPNTAAEAWRQYNLKKYGAETTGGGLHSVDPTGATRDKYNQLRESILSGPGRWSLPKEAAWNTVSGASTGFESHLAEQLATQKVEADKAKGEQMLAGIFQMIYGPQSKGGREAQLPVGGMTKENFGLATKGMQERRANETQDRLTNALTFNQTKAMQQVEPHPTAIKAAAEQLMAKEGWDKAMDRGVPVYTRAGGLLGYGTDTMTPQQEADYAARGRAALMQIQQQRSGNLENVALGHTAPTQRPTQGPSAPSLFSNTWSRPGQAPQKLPSYDKGGVVPGAPGEPQAAIVHGGETIIPNTPQASSREHAAILQIDRQNPSDPRVQHFNRLAMRFETDFGFDHATAVRAASAIAMGK